MGVCSSAHGLRTSSIAGPEDLPMSPSPKVHIDRAKARSSNPSSTSARYHGGHDARPLADDYEVESDEVLGEGVNGVVVIAVHRQSGRHFALKTFNKVRATKKVVQMLAAEVEIYLGLDHPNIARLHDVYESKESIHLVTELCSGGEMYKRLIRKGTYAEADARDASRQMLLAVGYLHSHRLVHRDLKLENFLYERDEEDAPLKLIDFGFAKVWDPATKMVATCGSIAYVSPDVLIGDGYTDKTDLWSLGVIVFLLLCGYPPISGTEADMKLKILEGKINWSHKSRWKDVSDAAVEFVKALLEKDPDARLSAHDALDHPWVQGTVSAKRARLSTSALRSLERYRKGSRVRRAVLQTLAQELGPDETQELAEIFLEMDKNHDGTISLGELKAAIRGSQEPCSPLSPKSPKTPASRLRLAPDANLAELFEVLDANHDEEIYYSDFLAATMEVRTQLQEDTLRSAFNRLDADSSGTISAEDLRRVLGDTFEGVDIEELIEEACRSQGGSAITFQSFITVLQERDVVPSPCHRRTARPKCFAAEDKFMIAAEDKFTTPDEFLSTVP